MKLSDNEKREIIKHLEADRPLPEKYRFLLFEEKREVELVWNGKTNEVCNVVLPFQTIEHVDEPRAEEDVRLQMDLFDPISGRQLKGWTNKLIWGDNKLILSSLKNGPLREAIEEQGGIKLIYIDPPFDVGADFSMDIEIGGDTFTKRPNLREAEKERQLEEKEAAFLDLILHAYRAERVEGFRTFHGKKAGRLVAVGPVNLPVTRLFVEEVILECRQKHLTRVDILAFEFEMGLFPNILDEARGKGIDLAMKYIPADVFDKRAVERNQVVFHDVSYIEVRPYVKGNLVAMELTDFSVFYSQDSIANAEATLKNKGSKIVVEEGQIVKVAKDKEGVVTREVLTRHWTDWIDYWAVDFDFESKREIIRVRREEGHGELERMEGPQGDLPMYEEVWTGDYVFENEWQSFRTKKDRSLDLKSVARECTPGRRKIAVKVVDIFGNDTMKIIEVTI